MDKVKTDEDDWWWSDFLENELGPDDVNQYQLLKTWVKESDPAKAFPIEERLSSLSLRVMKAISDES